MKPQSYKVQNGCYNCRLAFRKQDWDEGDSYFCNHDGSTRPICGSVSMSERWSGDHWDDKLFETNMSNWDKWAENREVMPWGICEKYEVS